MKFLFVGTVAALSLAGSIAVAQATTPTTPAAPQKKTCENYWTPVGKLYYSRAQYNEAYIAFRACVSLTPKAPAALYDLARAEIRLRLYSAAIGHLNEAIGADPKFFSGYIALSQAYTEQYENSSDRKTVADQLNKALSTLDDAENVAVRPEQKAAVFNERGKIYRYKGEYDKSLDSFKKAIGFQPNSAPILFNLGALQLQTGNLDGAIDSMRDAVGADPRDYVTRAYLAKLLRLKGDLKSARSEATQAYNSSTTSRKDAFVAGQYGIILYLQKDLSNATGVLEAATKMTNATAYAENFYYLGRVYLDRGVPKDARAALSKATAIDPLDPESWFYLGRANEALGEKDSACKSYTQALKAKPGHKDATDASGSLKCPAVTSAR